MTGVSPCTSRRKTVLRQCLLSFMSIILMLILAGCVLYAVDSLLPLTNLLRQARVGLLVWRLCLYAVCGACWFSLYRRLPAEQRPRLRRTAVAFLVLVALNEFCNALQWENSQ